MVFDKDGRINEEELILHFLSLTPGGLKRCV
jgi:hypothetical protein